MSADAVLADLIVALELPREARVDQRVPKKMLSENVAPTASDRRAISDGLEELIWLAALKPSTIGVPVYRDEAREYLEVAVLQLILRSGAKAARIIELTHRAVPYPVLLLALREEGASVSAAHKRWSQGEAGAIVIDGEIVEVRIEPASDERIRSPFSDALSLSHQPRVSLYDLYEGWINTLLAYSAASKTGQFALPRSADQAAARRDALAVCVRLEADVARLRKAATRERQLARQIAINLELKRREGELAAAYRQL